MDASCCLTPSSRSDERQRQCCSYSAAPPCCTALAAGPGDVDARAALRQAPRQQAPAVPPAGGDCEQGCSQAQAAMSTSSSEQQQAWEVTLSTRAAMSGNKLHLCHQLAGTVSLLNSKDAFKHKQQ
mmetsp:Transcript_5891/g.15672  ORF Transcript_5891/g.15672 Transcript_5891/m.15672 type:complete len:126 (+) Transcript_5891:2104-2481(+)